MANVKIPNTAAARKALSGIMTELKAPTNMRKYGEMAAGMVKLRTRLGSGVANDGADKGKLKGLAPSTIEKRKSLKKRGKLSDQTSARKSNLTESGQMLDSMQVTKAEYGSVTVGPKGSRRGGGRNERIAEYVTDQGRPFNNLSRVESKRVNDQIARDVRAKLKSALTKLK